MQEAPPKVIVSLKVSAETVPWLITDPELLKKMEPEAPRMVTLEPLVSVPLPDGLKIKLPLGADPRKMIWPLPPSVRSKVSAETVPWLITDPELLKKMEPEAPRMVTLEPIVSVPLPDGLKMKLPLGAEPPKMIWPLQPSVWSPLNCKSVKLLSLARVTLAFFKVNPFCKIRL